MQRTLRTTNRGFLWEMKHNRTLYLMCVPALLLLLAFAYVPMSGIYMAFTEFNARDGIFGSPFTGFSNFSYFLGNNQYFWNAVGNTLIINFWGLILGTILPITIAICMNFLTSNFRVDRKTGELIVTGANGIVNRLIMGAGGNPVRWYAEAKYWKTIIILLDVWKWAGYNSIIYMAAMVGFDGSLYEAATIDGASRFQQIRYLTVPMLKPTVVTLTLMSIGRIFYGDMGMIWGLVGQNATVLDAVTVIDTYVYTSMRTMGMGFSTAVGLCQGLMGLILILLANTLAKKINDGEGLF